MASVVREKTVMQAIAEMRNSLFNGADMVDLHLSCLENFDEESLRRIISSTKLPILALNYNLNYEWQSTNLNEEDRVESLLCAVRAGAAGIDMQGYTFHEPSRSGFAGEDKYSFTKGNPKEIVTDSAIIDKQCELIEQVHSMGAEVLLSCHPGVVMSCDQVVELALFLEKRKPDIIKIVTPANSEEDTLEAIKTIIALKKELKTPISFHAAGVHGRLTRVLNPALGGQIAFCIDRYNSGSTMEQIDLKTAKSVIEGIQRIL